MVMEPFNFLYHKLFKHRVKSLLHTADKQNDVRSFFAM